MRFTSLRSVIGEKKIHTIFLTNQIHNQNQLRFGHVRFPARHCFFKIFFCCHWFMIFSFALIGWCDKISFCFTTYLKAGVSNCLVIAEGGGRSKKEPNTEKRTLHFKCLNLLGQDHRNDYQYSSHKKWQPSKTKLRGLDVHRIKDKCAQEVTECIHCGHRGKHGT